MSNQGHFKVAGMTIPFLALFFLPIASSLSNFPIVHTSYGSIRGYEYRAKNGFVAEIFKKIPYASPPIGERRWKKPVPPEGWNYTIDGTFFGPGCPQNPPRFLTGHSEDCLTLNIYTSKACRESISCPVVLFIHGGNAVKSGTMDYTDEALVTNFASQCVIMITVDYRLGVFGVMALGDENVQPANLAVHDVLESLHFIHKEIHNFGGDKEEITIMGQSTGATIVSVLAFSPGANKPGESPLFARAIAMSTSAVLNDEDEQVRGSHAIAAELGCSGTAQEIIDCLMPFSTAEILHAISPEVRKTFDALVIDITIAGELLPIQNVKELFENQKPTKLLLGSTLVEVGFEPNLVNSHGCNIIGVRNKKECLEKYERDTESGSYEPVYNAMSQAYFMFNWMMAKAQAGAGGEVYLYQYDYPLNSIHADDLFYLMGSHERVLDENEEWLSRVYPLYFTNFIKGLPLAPDWNQLDPGFMNYYSVNKNFTDGIEPKMKLGYHRYISDYYIDMMKFDENLSKIKQMLFNSPVQYKQLYLSSEILSRRNIIFVSVLFSMITYFILTRYRICEQNVEKNPILSRR